MKSLMIIGGTGFFGKSILDYFLRGGLSKWNIGKVIVLARNIKQLEEEEPRLVKTNVELLTFDISTANYLPSADYIIHAAASTNATNYTNDSNKETENIRMGAENFCKLARKLSKTTKFLFVSSGAIYGNQPSVLSHIDERYQCNDFISMPNSKRGYASAKKDAELLIKKLGEDDFLVSIARCFSFIGKYLPRNQHFAIGNFIADGLAGRSIEVKANQLVYRSYMYSDDLVVWLMTILDNARADCPFYNVGSEEAYSMGELAKKIGDYFQVDVDLNEIDYIKIDRYVPATKKAFDELGLNCSSLNQAIHKTITEISKERIS